MLSARQVYGEMKWQLHHAGETAAILEIMVPGMFRPKPPTAPHVTLTDSIEALMVRRRAE
jgi:hypothetical protein